MTFREEPVEAREGGYVAGPPSSGDVLSLQEEYLACVQLACDRLDGLQEYGIPTGNATGLLVMHGAAMYARDTARVAAALLRQGETHAAGALARVVLEQAVLTQWLKADPEVRGQMFMQQSEVERARWFDVVLDAGFDLTGPEDAGLAGIEKERGLLTPRPKNVAREFDTPKNLFGDTKVGRQFYLTYRNLSQFVHPTVRVYARYTEELRFGLALKTTVQEEQDPEAVAYYLASALAMCALPYFDLLGEFEAGAVLGVAAHTAGLSTHLD